MAGHERWYQGQITAYEPRGKFSLTERSREVPSALPADVSQASLLLTTIASFCTTEPPAGSRILPYTNVIPYCFLLSSWAFAVAALVVGGASAFSVHKMSPVWFREVCPSSDPPFWLFGVNEGRDVGTGSDGFKASHLDHDVHPLSPLHHHRTLILVPRIWWASSSHQYTFENAN